MSFGALAGGVKAGAEWSTTDLTGTDIELLLRREQFHAQGNGGEEQMERTDQYVHWERVDEMETPNTTKHQQTPGWL